MNIRRMIGEVPGSTGLVGGCGPGEDRFNGGSMVHWANPVVRRAQTFCSSLRQRLRNGGLILLFSTCLGTVGAYAGDATWTGAGSSFNTDSNWSPSGVPTGIATFGSASTTAITSSATTLNTLQFNSGAPAYSFAINTITSSGFVMTGTGIVNSSSNAPTFTVSGGNLYFNGATSSAGNAIIINSGGDTTFNSSATAGTANITNNGGPLVGGFPTGLTAFQVSSTAGNSTITTNSTGEVAFLGASSGGQARFITNAGGFFDISFLTSAGTTAGSIEGAGAYQLGSKSLTVGGNNLSTGVSGNIVDGGFNVNSGTGASLVKVGTGTLTLSGADTYTGVTTVSAGTLQAGSTTGLSSSSAFTVTSTLDLGGFSNAVGSLAGAGNVTNNGGTVLRNFFSIFNSFYFSRPAFMRAVV